MSARLHASSLITASLRYLEALDEPALLGYARALIQRIETPITPRPERAAETLAAAWSERVAVQRAGLARANDEFHAWLSRPGSIEEIVETLYRLGIETGIDSIIPQLSLEDKTTRL